MNRHFLVGLAVLILAGCGDDSTSPSKPPPSGTATKKIVQIGNNFFRPKDLTVARGDTVVWFNGGSAGHTTTSGAGCSSDGLWDSGALGNGASFSVVFSDDGVSQTGTIAYFCIPHCGMGMTGTVTVTP